MPYWKCDTCDIVYGANITANIPVYKKKFTLVYQK